jgi:hypothetical protein
VSSSAISAPILPSVDEPVAVIGVSRRLPQAAGPEAFWQSLRQGAALSPNVRLTARTRHPVLGTGTASAVVFCPASMSSTQSSLVSRLRKPRRWTRSSGWPWNWHRSRWRTPASRTGRCAAAGLACLSARWRVTTRPWRPGCARIMQKCRTRQSAGSDSVALMDGPAECFAAPPSLDVLCLRPDAE